MKEREIEPGTSLTLLCGDAKQRLGPLEKRLGLIRSERAGLQGKPGCSGVLYRRRHAVGGFKLSQNRICLVQLAGQQEDTDLLDLSREIAQYGVNINNILPGMFRTEGMEESLPIYAEAFGLETERDIVMKHFGENNRIPAGFLADADDMAPMAALLCSPLSRFIVGQNIVIDGGQHYALF